MKKQAKKEKHVPMRTCIVTRVRKPKNELVRIVKTKDGVVVDPKGKLSGRGASIDMKLELLEQALSKGQLVKALRLGRRLTEGEVKNIRKGFIDLIEERQFRKGQKKIKIRVSKEELDRITKK